MNTIEKIVGRSPPLHHFACNFTRLRVVTPPLGHHRVTTSHHCGSSETTTFVVIRARCADL